MLQNTEIKNGAPGPSVKLQRRKFSGAEIYLDASREEEIGEAFISALVSRGFKDDRSVISQPGRGEVFRVVLDGGPSVIIRECLRGGWIRHFSYSTFLSLPQIAPRPFRELTVLAHLRSNSFPVPAPIAAVVWWGPLQLSYRGAVVTEEILEVENFLSLVLAESDESASAKKLLSIAFKAGYLADKMLCLGVFHPDLHLGNILVGNILVAQEESVYFIDFDKAEFISTGSIEKYRQRLVSRWFRSLGRNLASDPVIRKGLHAAFCKGLSS